MDDDASYNINSSEPSSTCVPESIEENEHLDSTIKYVKYTMKLPDMKSYQRIIFAAENNNFKGQIKWTDATNTTQSIIINDFSKYDKINDSNIEKAIDIANNIGHYINIAKISNRNDQIGYFRKINQICKKNTIFLDEIIENKLITDFSIIEILFYNKKQGMKLFNLSMNKSERNLHQLLNITSSGGGYKMLSAAATMSMVSARTPSSQHHQDDHDHENRDISMCIICYDEIREYIFSCGHCYTCKSCAEKILDSDPMNKCSYCKKDVSWVRKITMTEDQKNKDHYFKCISDDCYNIASIVTKCDPINEDDYGHHLSYCDKCYNNVKRDFKRSRKTHSCFCGKDITIIHDKVYFN
jgi:hypothetical protein